MRSAPSKKIFIVHGRDEKNKNELKKMLRRWGLQPIILADQPHGGRDLLQKLLDVARPSDIGFAFVLMTADDVGATTTHYAKFRDRLEGFMDTWHAEKGLGWPRSTRKQLLPHSDIEAAIKQSHAIFKPRARQNVVFEHGLCIGTLGPDKVCLLLSGELEKPSDILGRGYIPFKRTVTERNCRSAIRRELKDAGYD